MTRDKTLDVPGLERIHSGKVRDVYDCTLRGATGEPCDAVVLPHHLWV